MRVQKISRSKITCHLQRRAHSNTYSYILNSIEMQIHFNDNTPTTYDVVRPHILFIQIFNCLTILASVPQWRLPIGFLFIWKLPSIYFSGQSERRKKKLNNELYLSHSQWSNFAIQNSPNSGSAFLTDEFCSCSWNVKEKKMSSDICHLCLKLFFMYSYMQPFTKYQLAERMLI